MFQCHAVTYPLAAPYSGVGEHNWKKISQRKKYFAFNFVSTHDVSPVSVLNWNGTVRMKLKGFRSTRMSLMYKVFPSCLLMAAVILGRGTRWS